VGNKQLVMFSFGITFLRGIILGKWFNLKSFHLKYLIDANFILFVPSDFEKQHPEFSFMSL